MTMTDPLGDMLTRIRNGQRAGKNLVASPASKLRERVLGVLEREGYIRGYRRLDEDQDKPVLEIDLKYFEGAPVIQTIKRVSTPGRRVYSSIRELQPFANGLGISILSTPKGVLSDTEARDENVGGEVLCQVY
jgi:small subunit ribosomal protein S8